MSFHFNFFLFLHLDSFKILEIHLYSLTWLQLFINSYTEPQKLQFLIYSHFVKFLGSVSHLLHYLLSLAADSAKELVKEMCCDLIGTKVVKQKVGLTWQPCRVIVKIVRASSGIIPGKQPGDQNGYICFCFHNPWDWVGKWYKFPGTICPVILSVCEQPEWGTGAEVRCGCTWVSHAGS